MASRGGREEGNKGRWLRTDAWALGEPVSQADHVERRSSQDMLEMHPGMAPVARPPEIAGADPLRNSAFDARTCGVMYVVIKVVDFGHLGRIAGGIVHPLPEVARD